MECHSEGSVTSVTTTSSVEPSLKYDVDEEKHIHGGPVVRFCPSGAWVLSPAGFRKASFRKDTSFKKKKKQITEDDIKHKTVSLRVQSIYDTI